MRHKVNFWIPTCVSYVAHYNNSIILKYPYFIMLTRPTGPLYMVLIFKKIQKSVKLHFQ